MTDRNGDDKVLSYGDNLLRRSDVDLLAGPFWLNDQVLCLPFCPQNNFVWLLDANVPIHGHADHHFLL